MLLHFRIVAISYSSTLSHGILTGSEVFPRLPWLPNEISEECLILARFEGINQALTGLANKVDSAIDVKILAMGSD